MRLAILSLSLLGASCVCVLGAPNDHAPTTEVQAPVVKGQSPATPRPNTEGTSARPEAEREAASPGRPQLANSPEGLMLPGGVLLVQRALTRAGHLTEAESGTLDDQTSVALRAFQASQKLARTGAPDRETLERLGVSEDKVFRH